MRQDRFIRYTERYRSNIVNRLSEKIGYDVACELFSATILNILDSKKFIKIKTGKVRAYLHRAMRYRFNGYLHKQTHKQATVVRLPDTDMLGDDSDSLWYVSGYDETVAIECPFCHNGELNMYGACGLCYTILPTSRIIRRSDGVRMEHASLAVEFDYDKMLDVHKAIQQLDPLEQIVVKAIGMGHESLESLSALTHVHPKSLWKKWWKAKVKLQKLLRQYAQKPVSTHTPKQFTHALQVHENKQEKVASQENAFQGFNIVGEVHR